MLPERAASKSVLLPEAASDLTSALLPEKALALPRDNLDTLAPAIATVVTEPDIRSTPQSATTGVAPTDTNLALTSAMATVVTTLVAARSLSPDSTLTTAVTPNMAAPMAMVVLPLLTAVVISAMVPVLVLMTLTANRLTSIVDVIPAMVLAITADVIIDKSISTVALPMVHPFNLEVVVAVSFSLMLATNTEAKTLSDTVVAALNLSGLAVFSMLIATKVDTTAVSAKAKTICVTKLETLASEEIEMLELMLL